MSRIAMFGGTFNPPHRGHVEAARACVRALALDCILLMPAGIPPHKQLPANTPSAVHRLRMTELCAREIEHARVCTLELEREGKSYTADTVRELKKRFPDDTLWLVVGDDMLESFARWREPESIAAICRLAALQRKPEKERDIERAAQQLRLSIGARVDIVKNPVLPLSSTQYREGQNGEMLLETVQRYICHHGLYCPRPALDEVRLRMGRILSDRRLQHTLRVEQEAAELARIWKEDEYEARLAALLHDCAREMPVEKQLNLLEKYGIIIQYDSKEYPQLLHALTGSVLALREYGAPPSVAQAIRSHTLGSPGMSLLDKILFIADSIEPGRAYPGLEQLREKARRDLDSAVIDNMEQTCAYVCAQGKRPHPDAYLALDAMKREKNNERA